MAEKKIDAFTVRLPAQISAVLRTYLEETTGMTISEALQRCAFSFFEASQVKLQPSDETRAELSELLEQRLLAEGSADGEKLFISVPYNDSWKVKINGTDTVPETFGGCMTVVTLQKGMNEITMEYRPPYMTAGIISTCLGIVMAALTVFIYSKKTRPAKEK